jgi:phage terminase large subunit GpA-like protein
MMNAILRPEVREVVVMSSTQVGKSETMNNLLGRYIDIDPKAMMLVQPTADTAKDYSNLRIGPMIEHCPTLRQKIKEKIQKRSGNVTLLKEFIGGYLKIAGANSAPGLRSHPIEILCFDEVDAYPDDLDGEGDPVQIALRRTDRYPDKKIYYSSTPAKIKKWSKIENKFLESNQQHFFVPCPHCGLRQQLHWRDEAGEHRVVWERDRDGIPMEDSVVYLCAGCGMGIQEMYKNRMLDCGNWVARFPERKTIIGFHLNALYSTAPGIWWEMAKEWVKAKDDPEQLKTFINLRLGETWNEGIQDVEPKTLRVRQEKNIDEIPDGVGVLVGAADVQDNRIEAQIVGFGAGEEAWLIGHEVFWGDPGVQVDAATGIDVWSQLDAFFLRTWKAHSGTLLRPVLCLVDSGAHTDSVYDFVEPRQVSRHIYASKGVDYISKPGLVAEGVTKRAKIRLWTVATFAAKDRFFSRLGIAQKGKPGYIHLPEWVTDEYLEQMVSEKKIRVPVKQTRRMKSIYVQTNTRNEALDLWVYSLAALFILQKFTANPAFKDLGKLAQIVREGPKPQPAGSGGRQVRSPGL